MRRFELCAHLGYLFTELPLRERFAAAAGAGFRHVEHPSPYELSAQEVRALCSQHGLAFAQIALPAGQPGGKGLAALAGREAAFRAALAEGVAYAAAIGCRLIHPMAGTPDAGGADQASSWETYLANLACACDAARAAGLDVIIEPISAGAAPGYFMDHPQKALLAIERVGADNLFLMFDAFHAARCGVDPAAFARTSGARFRHVQIADAPGRREPGTGAIAFDPLFEALDDAGYAGVIGLEYRPATTTLAGLDWTARHPCLAPLAAA